MNACAFILQQGVADAENQDFGGGNSSHISGAIAERTTGCNMVRMRHRALVHGALSL
jgi:hypothetical protein